MVDAENAMLKQQIRKLENGETPYLSSKAMTTTRSLASILSVMMAGGSSESTEEDSVRSSPARGLLDLGEFKKALQVK